MCSLSAAHGDTPLTTQLQRSVWRQPYVNNGVCTTICQQIDPIAPRRCMQEKGALVALPKEEQNFTVGIGQTIVKNITSMYAGQFDRFGIGDYDTEIVTVIPYPENGVISVTGLSPGVNGY